MKNILGWKLFESKEKNRLIDYVKSYAGEDFKINKETGLIDIDGHMIIRGIELTTLEGLEFGNIRLDFVVASNLLRSLKGSPRRVGGTFYCYSNPLESLEYSPKIVGKDFVFNSTNILNLIGSPYRIGGKFEGLFLKNPITLEGAPRFVGGVFNVEDRSSGKLKMESGEWNPDGWIKYSENKLMKTLPYTNSEWWIERLNGSYDIDDIEYLSSLLDFRAFDPVRDRIFSEISENLKNTILAYHSVLGYMLD